MKILACTLIAGMLCPSLSAADEHLVLTSEEYQIRRLLEPSPAELAREVKGSALDREFDRMEFMMFIRIKDRKPDGEVVSYHDDDDC
jgi:hypothetical protein